MLHQTTWLFCPHCANKLEQTEAGLGKKCVSCLTQWFPRVDPVIITMITHGDSCLLCRLPSWAKRRYSCVAGFLESGETIEKCVQREVLEEVGISLSLERIKYVRSEPWPTEIASNLMIGCWATTDTTEFKILEPEIEDARWFKKSEIVEMMNGNQINLSFFLPGPWTTAYKLLQHWITS